jgi:hypothetical protein
MRMGMASRVWIGATRGPWGAGVAG